LERKQWPSFGAQTLIKAMIFTEMFGSIVFINLGKSISGCSQQ